MKHKFVSILTALALCLSLWPGTALAADTGITIDLPSKDTQTWDTSSGIEKGSIRYDAASKTLTLDNVQSDNDITITSTSVGYIQNLNIEITGKNSVNKIVLGSDTCNFSSHSVTLNESSSLDSYVYILRSKAATIYGNATISSAETIQTLTIAENAHLVIQSGGKLEIKMGGALTIEKDAELEIKSGGKVTIAGGVTNQLDIANGASLNIDTGGELKIDLTVPIYSTVAGSIVNNGVLSINTGESEAPDSLNRYTSELKLSSNSAGTVQAVDSSGNVTGIYDNSGEKKAVSPLTEDLDLSNEADDIDRQFDYSNDTSDNTNNTITHNFKEGDRLRDNST